MQYTDRSMRIAEIVKQSAENISHISTATHRFSCAVPAKYRGKYNRYKRLKIANDKRLLSQKAASMLMEALSVGKQIKIILSQPVPEYGHGANNPNVNGEFFQL